MEYEERVCEFRKYAKQTLDLMVDAYKWKAMAMDCDSEEMKQISPSGLTGRGRTDMLIGRDQGIGNRD